MEVGVRLDVTDDRHQGFGVHQRLERDVVELKLAGRGDHHAVELLFDQGAVGADAELAAEVERSFCDGLNGSREVQLRDVELRSLYDRFVENGFYRLRKFL